MRILCIDDEPDIVSLITEFLQLIGHTVVAAENGRRGLELFSADPGAFDLLISDVKMPQMGGLELLEVLRLGGHAIPVVLVSGHNDGSVEEAAKGHALVAVVPKPFNLDALKQVLDDLVE